MNPLIGGFLITSRRVINPTPLTFEIEAWEQRVQQEEDINQLGALYLELLLEESPPAGIQYGVHGKEDDVDYYDRCLPDPGRGVGDTFDAAREFLLEKLSSFDRDNPALALVYIDEGVPGHFVQLEYSNRAERLIPKVFWNGAMVEGWAAYITTQMVSGGFTVYPEHPLGQKLQRMADLKMVLRNLTNAIMDIRLHRSDWPEEEAMALMLDRGYQQPGEAQGKLGRARMGAVQLASYFAGQLAIEDILMEYRAARGDAFTYKEFNERLVSAGSPPLFAIREFMLAGLAEGDSDSAPPNIAGAGNNSSASGTVGE